MVPIKEWEKKRKSPKVDIKKVLIEDGPKFEKVRVREKSVWIESCELLKIGPGFRLKARSFPSFPPAAPVN